MGEAALVPASPSQPTADAETDERAERAREDVVFLGRPGIHGDVGERASAGGIDARRDDAASATPARARLRSGRRLRRRPPYCGA